MRLLLVGMGGQGTIKIGREEAGGATPAVLQRTRNIQVKVTEKFDVTMIVYYYWCTGN